MLLMLLDDSDPHVAPLCIHPKQFDPSLQQSDGVGILVHPTSPLRCPQTFCCSVGDYRRGDKVGMWRCFHSAGQFTHRSCFESLQGSPFCAIFIPLYFCCCRIQNPLCWLFTSRGTRLDILHWERNQTSLKSSIYKTRLPLVWHAYFLWDYIKGALQLGDEGQARGGKKEPEFGEISFERRCGTSGSRRLGPLSMWTNISGQWRVRRAKCLSLGRRWVSALGFGGWRWFRCSYEGAAG